MVEFIDNVNGKRKVVDPKAVEIQDVIDFLQKRKGIDEIKPRIIEPETGFELVTSSLQKMRSTN